MDRDGRAYLWNMREAADLVCVFMGRATLESYLGDVLLRSAIERQLQNLGESLVQLAKADPTLATRIPEHREVIGFRNVLVHGYTQLNNTRVWEAVNEKLPALRAAIDALLTELGPPSA